MNFRFASLLAVLMLSGASMAFDPAEDFVCKGKNVKLHYIDRPSFGDLSLDMTYQGKDFSVSGEELELSGSSLGVMIKIQGERIPDYVGQSFTLIMPTVNLAPEESYKFKTMLFETKTRTTIAGHRGVRGVIQESSPISLSCTATKDSD